jgi:hypothetical protein
MYKLQFSNKQLTTTEQMPPLEIDFSKVPDSPQINSTPSSTEMILRTGSDVIILKIISPEKIGENGVLIQNTAFMYICTYMQKIAF